VDPAKTLDAALQLRPDTKTVVVVGGVHPYDRHLEAIVKKSLSSYESKLDFVYLTNPEMPRLLEGLRLLPDHSIILYTAISQDARGTRYVDETQSLPMVVNAANAPVFVMEDTFIGQGAVGGYVTLYSHIGQVIGGIAVRILEGEKPENIPIVKDSNVLAFDWRALRRWGFIASSLPPGSVVLYRQPTVWESYTKYFNVVGSIFVLETFLVLALLWQRARRRKVEESLVERLSFETLLSDLSTTFLNLREEKVSSSLQKSLGRIGATLKMDRITLFEFSQDRKEVAKSFGWTIQGVPASPLSMKADGMPLWTESILRGQVLAISDVNDLPDNASPEKNCLRTYNIVSGASVPLEVGGEVFGAITFATPARRVVWSEDLIQRLKMLAEIFSNAIGRKQAEARRRETEERFQLVANTAPVLIWMSGTDKLCNYFNQGWLDFTGRPLEAELGNGWADGVHSADLQSCMESYSEAFERRQRFAMVYRLRRHDGEFRWILDVGVPRFNADGSFAGYIGSGMDVTVHKEAEQALATVSGRLIQAQEEERRRIARELHDDISQRLALLSVELQGLANVRPKSSAELRDRTDQLLKRISDMASDIHALSHRLHSSKLDYVGAVAAMAGFCNEITAQTGLLIDFEHADAPKFLPQDISLCLFRVLQEGLRNAVKYSGTRNFNVQLRGVPGAILLLMRDSGAGFDPEAAMKNGGLGLISMRERVSLVKGTISITSKPMAGTEIRIQIPIPQADEVGESEINFPLMKGVYGTTEDSDLIG
jgi:PAS domain S-box-containing protein